MTANIGSVYEDIPSQHPAGLRTLFFTEMWERMSYYGMRALLVLFMVDSVDDGGLGFSDESATAIYGLYTAAVYMVMLPGGWIADRLLGAQKTVWYGAIVIMCGHFILAIPSFYTFFLGLLFIVVGTGLLKPNISAIVGELYLPNDPRRDAGFTIFYMGINLGGALGPLICSTLGESEKFGWHYGFAAAGVGMLFGLIQFYFSSARLGDAGLKPSLDPDDPDDQIKIRNGWRYVGAGFCIILILAGLMLGQVISVKPLQLAQNATFFIVALAGFYFFYIFAFGGLSLVEKRRVCVIVILFFAAAIFWAGFEQAGSSLNLFAERYTDRMIGDFEVPAGWFQSLNPAFIIILAPVYSAVWIALARRHMDPSTPAKFALGLIILALGFAIMIGAAKLVVTGDKVLPTWLIFTYLFHTMGELALSPVGLSAMTKLAPRRYVGQMMGVFFLGASLGNVIAGLIAGEFRADTINEMPALYTQIVLTTAGCGLLLALFTKPIRTLMSGVE
jgi:POT family proton-dependent oligopeptide transporter